MKQIILTILVSSLIIMGCNNNNKPDTSTKKFDINSFQKVGFDEGIKTPNDIISLQFNFKEEKNQIEVYVKMSDIPNIISKSRHEINLIKIQFDLLDINKKIIYSKKFNADMEYMNKPFKHLAIVQIIVPEKKINYSEVKFIATKCDAKIPINIIKNKYNVGIKNNDIQISRKGNSIEMIVGEKWNEDVEFPEDTFLAIIGYDKSGNMINNYTEIIYGNKFIIQTSEYIKSLELYQCNDFYNYSKTYEIKK